MTLTPSDLRALVTWALRHTREAVTALVQRGTTGLVDAWETHEIAAMLAADEARREEELRRRAHDLVQGAIDSWRAETVLVIQAPMFALKKQGEEWRWN